MGDQSRPSGLRGLLTDRRRTALFCALAVCLFTSIDVLSDPDMWWHIRLGQLITGQGRIPTGEPFSFTGPGSPLVAHEWLMDVLFAGISRVGGIFLLALVMGLVSLGAFAVMARRSLDRGAGPLLTAGVLVLAAKAAAPVLGTRPQVITFLLVGVVLLLADMALKGRTRWLIAVPPIFLFWANAHAGFVAGLGVLAVTVGAEVLVGWIRKQLVPRRAVLLLAAATLGGSLAACLNPLGVGLYRFALVTSSSERSKPITEWQPPNFTNPGLFVLLAFLLIFAGALIRVISSRALRNQLQLRDVLLAVAGAGLTLYAVRNTAIGMVLMVPLLAQSLHLILETRTNVQQKRPRPTLGLPVILLVATGLIGMVTLQRAAEAASPAGVARAYPSCAVDILLGVPTDQRVFVTYADAGYVIERGWPHLRVYEYGESISLGRGIFDNYVRIARDEQAAPSARQLLDESGTTAVLTNSTALTSDLRAHGWRTVAHDGRSTLLARSAAAWAAGKSCP